MQSDGSFSIMIVRRLLSVLAEHNSGINRTNLACKAGLNYGACLRYIELLATLRWVTPSRMQGGHVFLTKTGWEFMTLLQQNEKSLEEGAEKYSLDFMEHPNRQSLERSESSISGSHRIHDYSLCGSDRDANENPCSANIMIVEDDQDLLLTYKLYLTGRGYNVSAFSDPCEALQEFARDLHRSIDLVISDIRMKPINGIQLYGDLKSIEPNIRIMFVSALDAAPELASALPGFRKEDLLAKPVDQKMFTNAIDEAVAGKRQLRLGVASDSIPSN